MYSFERLHSRTWADGIGRGETENVASPLSLSQPCKAVVERPFLEVFQQHWCHPLSPAARQIWYTPENTHLSALGWN